MTKSLLSTKKNQSIIQQVLNIFQYSEHFFYRGID